jgi:Xaa-Pro aminopeptidase
MGDAVLSTELFVGGQVSSIPGALDLTVEFDRVLVTAADRPSHDSLPVRCDPTADHQDIELVRRRADVEIKHQRIRDFLDATRHDAVVLRRADSIAWFTSGADLGRDLGSSDSAIVLYINRACRAVVADNVQSGRVFEEELAGLGFQLKEQSWYDEPDRVISELCRNKSIASDDCTPGPRRTPAQALRELRRSLTPLERQRYRELGRTLALAVEATCRNFDRGEREADVAGHLAHRLLREGVVPVELRVASDDRLDRFRQPTSKDAPILRRASINVTGRRHGLCASLTRTVSFGLGDAQFRTDHTLATMVDATSIFFSRPGEPLSEIFRRSKRIYEKYNRPHEWTLDYQGHLTGYSPRELALRPETSLTLDPSTAISWSPSVGAARTQDTMVVDSRGFEIVTAAQDWPQVEVSVKGFVIPRPGILIR